MRRLFAALSVPAFLGVALFERYGVTVRAGLFLGHEYWRDELSTAFSAGVALSSALLLASCVLPGPRASLVARGLGSAGLTAALLACWATSPDPRLTLASAQLFFVLSVCAWIRGLDVPARAAGVLLALTSLPIILYALGEFRWPPDADDLAGGSALLAVIAALLYVSWRVARGSDRWPLRVGFAWSVWEICRRLVLLHIRHELSLGPTSRPLDFWAEVVGEAPWICLTIALSALLAVLMVFGGRRDTPRA